MRNKNPLKNTEPIKKKLSLYKVEFEMKGKKYDATYGGGRLYYFKNKEDALNYAKGMELRYEGERKKVRVKKLK